MELLWEQAPLTITQITHLLEDKTGWTKYTVITLLKRLDKKGAVYYEQKERAKQYYPVISRENTLSGALNNFIKETFSGNFGLMISTLVQNKELSQEDIAEMRRILDEAGKENENK